MFELDWTHIPISQTSNWLKWLLAQNIQYEVRPIGLIFFNKDDRMLFKLAWGEKVK